LFNNNINKPAKTVFLPLTSAEKHWQKLFLPGLFFPQKKAVLTSHWQKLANPGNEQAQGSTESTAGKEQASNVTETPVAVEMC